MFNRLTYLSCSIFIALSFLLICVPNSSASTQVILEWSPNSEPDLAGYRVFVREEGQSYDYANPEWETINTTCTIYDLDETKTYHFVARAYDIEGFESGDSNEVTLEPVPVIEVDNVFIMSVVYNAKRKTLSVKAVSDAPARSVILTAWADSVKLGNLKYSAKKKVYSKTFRKVNPTPNVVTVMSSGGGYDDKEM